MARWEEPAGAEIHTGSGCGPTTADNGERSPLPAVTERRLAGTRPITYSALRSERPRALAPGSREESGWRQAPPRSSAAGLRTRPAARGCGAPRSRTERSRLSAPPAPGSPGFASAPAPTPASWAGLRRTGTAPTPAAAAASEPHASSRPRSGSDAPVVWGFLPCICSGKCVAEQEVSFQSNASKRIRHLQASGDRETQTLQCARGDMGVTAREVINHHGHSPWAWRRQQL